MQDLPTTRNDGTSNDRMSNGGTNQAAAVAVAVFGTGAVNYAAGWCGGWFTSTGMLLGFVGTAVAMWLGMRIMKPYTVGVILLILLGCGMAYPIGQNTGMRNAARAQIQAVYGTGSEGRHMQEKFLGPGPETDLDLQSRANWYIGFVYAGIVVAVHTIRARPWRKHGGIADTDS